MKKLNFLKKALLLIIAIVFAYVGASSQCVSNTANVYTVTATGKIYEIVKEAKTWVNAASCAVERGGVLAEIESQTENDLIFGKISSSGITNNNTTADDGGGGAYLWIGGNDITTEGTWVWNGNNDANSTQFWNGTETGSAVGGLYNNWGDKTSQNEPDNFVLTDATGQDGLALSIDGWPLGDAGEWNDVAKSNLLYFVIEKSSSTTAIDDINKTSFKLYPNPATDKITIELDKKSIVSITNTMGVVLYSANLQTGKNEINISNFPSGVYFIKSSNKLTKFIKE